MTPYLQPYSATGHPELITVPATKYMMMNKAVLAESTEALKVAIVLDILSNAIQTYMNDNLNMQYDVFPLEGVWHLLDDKRGFSNPENIQGRMMIKQPLELTAETFEQIKTHVAQSQEGADADMGDYMGEVTLQLQALQTLIQMLHLGPYREESRTFAIMNKFARSKHLSERGTYHREIYLKDIRHTTPDNFETILRIEV